MYVELDPLLIIDVFSFTTALTLGLLFILKPASNRHANIFLGLMLWSLGLEVLGVLAELGDHAALWVPHSSMFTLPLLLLYIFHTINQRVPRPLYLMFLPGILLNFISYDDMAPHLIEYAFNLSILGYSLVVLKKHAQRVNNFYSEREHKTLKWIRFILYVFIGFHLLWITEDVLSLWGHLLPELLAASSTIFTFLLIFWIAYNGFSQPELFQQQMFLIPTPDKEEVQPANRKNEDYDRLLNLLEKDKPYTHPKLNLRMLAAHMQMNEKELSALINGEAKCNFYTFINQYRVKEFKYLLSTPKAEQMSLLGLAQEAGFHSKSTFYSTFKRLEGCTPKAYIEGMGKSE